MPKTMTDKEIKEVFAPIPELKECSFQVPLKDQPGMEYAADAMHTNLMMGLAHQFGGCSGSAVMGAWRPGDKPEDGEAAQIIVEPMFVLTCALSEKDEGDFHSYAMAAVRVFKQEALYWRDRKGIAHIEPVIEGRFH